MLSKCLNPACSRPFRYLHEGQVFQIDMAVDLPGSDTTGHLIEYFWLCAQCCATLQVVIRDGVACVEPRYRELPWKEDPKEAGKESLSSSWRRAAHNR